MEEKIIGIYKIENLINGKVYIGQSWDIYRRFKQHKQNARKTHLYNSIKKYGLENFSFTIIKQLKDHPTLTQILLNLYEDFYIKKYNSINCIFGYNERYGGSNGKMSQQTKQLMSTSKMGHYVSSTTCEKISLARLGHEVSEKTRQKIRETSTGKKWSKRKDGTGENISKSLVGLRKDVVWIHLYNINKTVFENQLYNFLLNGWELGTYPKNIKHSEHRKWIHNGKDKLYVLNENVDRYLNDGWKLNKVERVKINNGINIFSVYDYELDEYLNNGYSLGTLTHKQINASPEYRNKISKSNKGKVYVTRDSVVKSVKPEELNNYLNQGFLLKKKLKFNYI